MSALRLGILSDTQEKQELLAQLVSHAGHELACKHLLKPLLGADLQGSAVPAQGTDSHAVATTADTQVIDSALIDAKVIDAWVIDISEDHLEQSPLLEQLYTESRVPIILSDSSEHPQGSEAYQAWFKRSTQRLQRLYSDINLNQTRAASELWVLAASTGGPAAIKRFIARLPANLGIAFLYVQHLDANQLPTINRMINSSGQYPAIIATPGAVLGPNCMVIASGRDHLHILDNGTVQVNYNHPWPGSYAPSIDQIAANAARIYRARSGLIIFTGMGDDGADSSRLVKQLGGQVWVQTPSDCTSDSMPLSALATGCVSFNGTPEELADALARQTHTRASLTQLATVTTPNQLTGNRP